MDYKNCKYCHSQTKVLNKSFSLLECNNCGLIFSGKKFSQEELQKKYSELYNKGGEAKYAVHAVEDYNNLKNGRFKIGYNRKRILHKYVKNNDRILEIGAGVGLTGAYLKSSYQRIEYKGVEIDVNTSEKARAMGVEVYQGDFSSIKDLEGKFDVVMMWEVLEHIQDLKICLELVFEKLNKEGVFLFSVPNYNKRLNYKHAGDRIFQSGPPVHLNFFRKSSILYIFNSRLFDLQQIRVKKFPYANFLSGSFYKMIPRIILGNYHGSTLFCAASPKK